MTVLCTCDARYLGRHVMRLDTGYLLCVRALPPRGQRSIQVKVEVTGVNSLHCRRLQLLAQLLHTPTCMRCTQCGG